MKSAGKTSLIRDPDLKKAIFEYYQTMERLDDWTHIKRVDHQRMTRILSEVMPHELRLWVNYRVPEKDSLWRAAAPDPELMREALKQHPDFEAALEGVIFTANRLIIERAWRDGETHRLEELLVAYLERDHSE